MQVEKPRLRIRKRAPRVNSDRPNQEEAGDRDRVPPDFPNGWSTEEGTHYTGLIGDDSQETRDKNGHLIRED